MRSCLLCRSLSWVEGLALLGLLLQSLRRSPACILHASLLGCHGSSAYNATSSTHSDSEQNLLVNSFLPSNEIALAKALSARSFTGIHEPFSAFAKPSQTIPDRISFESKRGKDHTSTGERQSPGSRQQHKTTNQTPNPVSTNTESSSENGFSQMR